MGRVVPAPPRHQRRVLTPLQQRIAELVASLPESEGFALAGGSALIAAGMVDRPTRDLDFFTTSADHVDRFLPVVEEALEAAGHGVERRQVGHGFARLVVSAGDEATVVDLATDARLLPVERSRYGWALSGEELGVDKVLAVFGRAEARDFADLVALDVLYQLPHLFVLAREKDRGFRVAVFREMLDAFERLARDEFDVTDGAYSDVAVAVSRWRDEIDAGHWCDAE